MLVAEQIGIEHAYRVLGVPREAPAHTIKQAYRKLVKRWHPDLYTAGTTAHAEATEMSRVINEAYATVSHAPLRYESNFVAYANRKKEHARRVSPDATATATDKPLPRLDRIEFWARFVCGAVLGLFVALEAGISNVAIVMDLSLKGWLVGAVLIMAGSGLLAAKLGNKFWYSLMEKWFD